MAPHECQLDVLLEHILTAARRVLVFAVVQNDLFPVDDSSVAGYVARTRRSIRKRATCLAKTARSFTSTPIMSCRCAGRPRRPSSPSAQPRSSRMTASWIR